MSFQDLFWLFCIISIHLSLQDRISGKATSNVVHNLMELQQGCTRFAVIKLINIIIQIRVERTGW
jgi:hypothetical protein